ncbi:MAG TPA: metallopeptidase TldD-related protein [Thermoanaerobaculia bacterium]|nr:metallopeptidase TldD-related protein [Thermoanaerobaculia bacterium]
MPTPELPSLDIAREILVRALAESPADRTEISWTEAIHRQERSAPGEAKREGRRSPQGSPVRPEPGMHRELSLIVRVVERGRIGIHRAAALDRAELAAAIRRALADARLAPPAKAAPEGAVKISATPEIAGDLLWDAEIADLAADEAKALLSQGLGADENARFAWTEGRIGYAATGSPPRVASLTGAALELRAGRGPATGSASGVARKLSALAPCRLLDLARERRADPTLAAPSGAAVPLLLAPQAAARLATAFARAALDSRAIEEALDRGARNGSAWPLFGHLGEQIASSRITLADDATDSLGLPLPFDAQGASSRRIELIAAGIFRGAAVTQPQAAALGLPASLAELPLAIDFDQAAPLHLALSASDPAAALAPEDLLAAADGGLWIAALSPLEVYDPGTLRFRAVAHGVRRIEGGKIGPAVPNLIWEASLLEVFARIAAFGAERIAVSDRSHGAPWLGATLAPAMALEPLFTLRAV